MKNISLEQTYTWRGLAACSVIISHYSKWYMGNGEYGIIAQLLGTIGRYGVAIFLFLSGYGLVCSIRNKNGIDKHFIYKRILNVYFPYLIIRLIIEVANHSEILGTNFFRFIFALDNWYIATIIVFYLFLYISYRYFYPYRIQVLVVCITCYSFLVYFLNINEAWYLSNVCFIMGVLYSEFVGDTEEICFQKRLRNILICTNKGRKELIIFAILFVLMYPTYLFLKLKKVSIYLLVKILISIVFTNLVIQCSDYLDSYKFRIIRYCGTISLELFLIHEGWLNCFHISNRVANIIVSLILTFFSACIFNKMYSCFKRKVRSA